MKFTDLFVKRPVLAMVVNLVILIAGLQAIRTLSVRQYPRSDISVVTVTTAYIGANADLVRGFITTPLERVIASADGIDYLESSSAQGVSTITVHLKLNYDTNAALTQVQAKVAQVRNDLPPEAEAPVIELATADTEFASMYIGFSSDQLDQNQITDYLVRVVQPKLAAVSGRAARRHPGQPHVRDARLAEAREDGRPRHRAQRRPRRALREQLSLGDRADQGLDDLGQSRREHGPEDRGRVPPARGQAEERRRRTPRRDRRRRARRRGLRVERPVQRAGRDLHGHLGAADGQLPRGHQARPGRDSGDPVAAAGRDEGRHPLRRDRVHPGRHQRGALDAVGDAGHRHHRDLPLPRLVPGRPDPHRRDPDLPRRRGVSDARRRVHDQPADAARDRAVRRSRGRRRDRHGRKRRAPPGARREALRGRDQGGPRARRTDHRHDDHAGRGLRAHRHPGRPDRRALPRVRVHPGRGGRDLGHRGPHALADDGLEVPPLGRHREGVRRLDQPPLREGARRRTASC